MLEFKLNYYVEKYKDTCMISTTEFKNRFIKENGEFPLLSELVIMIHKYQMRTYGDLVTKGLWCGRNVKKGTYYRKAEQRERCKFGTKEERKRRKLYEKWNS